MEFLLPIVALPIVLALSLIIIRVGTMALMLTGLSRETARFQSHSSFTGVGFTTSEAEAITQHPIRRHIVMAQMVAGNVVMATGISVLLLALQNVGDSKHLSVGLVVLVIGVTILWIVASSKWIEARMNNLISTALQKLSHLEIRDYVSLLELSKGFSVTELLVEPDDWISDKSLTALALAREGVLVLGIKRQNGDYVGAPAGNSHILPNDTIVAYGPLKRLQELATRKAGPEGDAAHELSIQEYDEYLANLKQVDPDS